METTHRLRGVAVGAAVGDALGMPLEFDYASPPGQMIREMRAGRLPAGSFTDDTEMALALAESLLAKRGLDPDDISAHFLDWYKRRPPDVGIHTSNVLQQVAHGEHWQTAAVKVQSRYPESAGNGSIMRCWPVAVMCWQDEATLDSWSRQQSQVTHAHEECIAACAFVNTMIAQLVGDVSPQNAFNYACKQVRMPESLHQVIRLAPHRKRDELPNTAGTVVGALAGAAYGVEAIPDSWTEKLHGEWPLKSNTFWGISDFTALADRLAGSLDLGL